MKQEVDFKAARKFLSVLAPDADEFTYQLFSDRAELKERNPATAKPFDPNARCFVKPFEEAADQLANRNARGIGVFVTINSTKGSGRKLANFDKARALFADLDGAPMPKWPVEPTMIVESSRGKFHCYWCLSDYMPLEIWRGSMRRIVESYGADHNAALPVQVLRIPGFYHCKAGPVMVRLVKCSGRRYTAAQLVKAFPPIKQSRKAKTDKAQATLTEVDLGELRSALEHLAATLHPQLRDVRGRYVDDYSTWLRFGIAIKRDLGDDGFEIWDEWSRFSDVYPGEEAARTKWEGFDVGSRSGNDAVHIGTILFTARRQGWSRVAYHRQAALEKARKLWRVA
jgi:hypothetical protein